MTLKWGQGHQNLINSLVCPNNLPLPVWWNSTQWFKRYWGYSGNFTYLSPVTLKMRSRSLKSNQLLSLSQQYIHACLVKFRRLAQEIIHIVGYKKRMLKESALKPVWIPHLRGRGHKNSEIAGTAFYFLRLNLCAKRQITYSHCSAAKQRWNDVILTSVGHNNVAVGHHFEVMCQ